MRVLSRAARAWQYSQEVRNLLEKEILLERITHDSR